MDIKWTPEQRNKWTATKVHAELDSSDMLFAESKHTRYGVDVQQHYTFDLPTPSFYIGAMIGKDGRNINNLIVKLIYELQLLNIPIVKLRSEIQHVNILRVNLRSLFQTIQIFIVRFRSFFQTINILIVKLRSDFETSIFSL